MAAKLLLAEDSLTIQKVFELTFKQSGISLAMVDNGYDAVRLAQEIHPDLVVADVSLPGKDGFEVAAELRSQEKIGSCPVLILAGSLAPFDEEKFRSCGASGVLFKPFESQELIDKVEDLLRGKEEPAPAPAEEEPVSASAPEPWDFSDVMSEMEKESAVAEPRAAAEADFPSMEGASVSAKESTLSLGDFDVSLDEIEAGPEKETVSREAEIPKEERPEAFPPPVDDAEERSRTVGHIEEPVFEDSPPAVTDLSPAFEAIEELDEVDFLEVMETPEGEAPGPSPEEAAAPSPPVSPEPPVDREEREPEGTPPPAAVLPASEELREMFAARAQEIFERIAAETVEKVMWEVMEKLTKEFTEKIRESVEAVAWEVIPATTEALIREEIDRIREEAGKESS